MVYKLFRLTDNKLKFLQDKERDEVCYCTAEVAINREVSQSPGMTTSLCPKFHIKWLPGTDSNRQPSG